MEGKYRPPTIPFISGTDFDIKDGSLTTLTCRPEKSTHGVHADWAKQTQAATDHATALWQDADLSLSTYQKTGTTNFATASSPQMLHSAMALTGSWLGPITNPTEGSMKFGEKSCIYSVSSTCGGIGILDCRYLGKLLLLSLFCFYF